MTWESVFMTLIKSKLFYWVALIALPMLLTSCPPSQPLAKQEADTFTASKNKLCDASSEFDLRWNVTYPKGEAQFNPSLNVSDQELAFNRCTLCHECGFEKAFDYDNFGKPGWKPVYKGEQWQPIVSRMNQKEGALLNEQVSNRIYTYLHDVTLGKYDESKDDKGALVVEVNPEDAGKIPGNQDSDASGDGESGTSLTGSAQDGSSSSAAGEGN
jgi:hypothetical protein